MKSETTFQRKSWLPWLDMMLLTEYDKYQTNSIYISRLACIALTSKFGNVGGVCKPTDLG